MAEISGFESPVTPPGCRSGGGPGSAAEIAGFESPVVKAYRDAGDADLVLADVSAAAKTVVRAAPDTSAAADLGVAFGASRRHRGVLVCGLRPGEWMLVGASGANAAMAATLDTSGPVSVVDHTHSRALFRLTGADAVSVLEKLCSVDWSDPMTPNGAVVSAPVAAVSCDLIRDDKEGLRSYLIACDRSLGQYLFDAVIDAGEEFGIGVRR